LLPIKPIAMKKITPVLIFLISSTFLLKAQQAAIPVYQEYGKVDKQDLEMTACDFEKDANAEVLIDKGDLYYDSQWNVTIERHKRIKIFNDNGKENANVRLEYISYEHLEYITGLQAETINLTDGKVEITKIDKKQIYTQAIDKYRSAITFSMPNVKAGSIIEFKYNWTTSDLTNMPPWYFQEKIPVRYSEIFTHIPEYFYFTVQSKVYKPYAISSSTTENGRLGMGSDAISYNVDAQRKVLVNIPSLPEEPFMSSYTDNLESLHYHLTSFRPPYGFVQNFSDTWAKVGGNLIDNEDFGHQLKRKLTNEDEIVNAAKALKTEDEKIAYVFNAVKNAMKWNGNNNWYTVDGTSEAWTKKTGNSTEINLILYHLLKKSGVNALPMIVSTRDHGKVNPIFTFLYQFNSTVVYIPVDSTKRYILDASNKYNTYNDVPYNVLNSYALYLNMDEKTYDLLFIQKPEPVKRYVYVNAAITADGKINGKATISSYSFNRVNEIDKYKTDGEKKFINYLTGDDNNLKISALKIDNMDVDTLPLVQGMDFTDDLAGSDNSYIYVNPNLFTSLHKNPFLSENRNTDIDFGYLDNLNYNSIYKIPDGFKVDALPKSVSMSLPDGSINFRRIVVEQGDNIAVRYFIKYNKTIYFKENYDDFHNFYKKMYELLNEPIVLKKS
jgi:hypothetical protein